MRFRSRALRVLALIVAALACVAAGTPQYKVAKTFKTGGDGGWDYITIDPDTHNLFISRGTHVMVVNAGTGASVADIAGTDGVHGIALAHELNKGFTSNGRGNSVTVFDLKALKETTKVAIQGENPDAILYDPATKRVFTFNGRSMNSTAIDATSNSVLGNIALDGKPETGVSDGKGMVYVNIEDKSEIQQLDARNLKVVNTWSIAPCEEPSGLAMDQKERRLFAGCHNQMMAIVNADTGKVVATPAIGRGVDANGWDPGRKLAFSSNGDGTLTIVQQESADKYSVAQNVQTASGARTMSVDPNTHNIYLVTAQYQPAPDAAAPANPSSGTTSAAPAAAGGQQPPQRPRRQMVPGSFEVLVVSSD